MRSIIMATVLCLGFSQAVKAFDFGSAIETLTPVAQSVAPLADKAVVSNPLIKNLTTSLGVTPTQAIGGTAALLNNAKSNMSPSNYTSLTKQMPQVGMLLDAAPAGLLGSSGLDSQFSKLGMNTSMISSFVPIIMQYIQSGVKPSMAQLVQTALVK